MKDILELRETRSHLTLSAGDILKRAEAENRYLTPDEQKQSDELMVKADAITDEIASINAAIAQAEKIKTKVSDNGKADQPRAPIAQPSSEPKASTAITPLPRYSSLKAFVAKDGKERAEDAYASGMWLIANFFGSDNPNHRKAREYCSQHLPGEYWNAMSTGVPAAGGNLVPDVMAQTIIDLREQYGVFRQWCDVMPMSSDYQIVPRRSGSVTPSWTAEGVAITASSPTFDNVTLTAKKLAAYTLISSELTEDAIINVADWVTMDIGKQFAYEEDRVGFKGTGIASDGNINGLFNKATEAGSAGSFIVVATATHNTFAELDATDIATLMAACPQYALNGAAFFVSQNGAQLTFGRLMAAAGGNTQITLAAENISAARAKGIIGYYQGYPIVGCQVLPVESDTKTNVGMLAFGNLRMAATLGERRQVRFAMDSSIKFAEDQIAIKATTRLDINIHDLGSATVAGPIVVLKGGSS